MRDLRRNILLIVGLLLLAATAFPQANNDCGSATTVTDLTGTCNTYDNTGYTFDVGNGSCVEGSNNVWFSFTAQGPDLDVTVSGISRPEITIVSFATPCNITGAAVIGCEDANGNYSSITYSGTGVLTSGQTYYIVVTTNADVSGTYDLCVTNPLVVSCSDCAGATAIASLPLSSAGLTTCGECDNYTSSDACGSTYMDGEDYLFSYTPASATAIDIDVTNTSGWAGIHVFDGCPDVGGTNCINQANNGAASSVSLTNVSLTGGTTYYIAVSTDPGSGANCTGFDIDITTNASACSSCATATSIPSLPFSGSGYTTCGACNDYTSANACASAYMDGEDYVFSYTAAATDTMQVELSNNGNWMGLFVLDGCPDAPGTSCIASNAATSGNPSIPAVEFQAGNTYYIIVDTDPNGNPCDAFDIDFTVPTIPSVQDCPEAIPLCTDVYSETNAYSGIGNIAGEINSGPSCLGSGEKNDVWYTFTVIAAGDVCFDITPNVLSDDYDWAVFDLTNNECADIYSTPTLEVSCNYSGTSGVTGPNNDGGFNDEPCIAVNAGETYVVNVSQFSTSTNGYTIDFSESTASIFDNDPPALDTVFQPACGSTLMSFEFDELIDCSTIQLGDFALTGPGGPYTITNPSGSWCLVGASGEDEFTVNVSPPITTPGTYTFALTNAVGSVDDLCGNTAPPSSVTFDVQTITASIAASTNASCGGATDGTATGAGTGGTAPFSYQWNNGQTTATATGLAPGTYTVTVADINLCSDTASVTISGGGSMVLDVSKTDESCGGGSDGAATATIISGGTTPFTYAWSNGGSTATITGLSGATYTVTVTDAAGCTTSNSVTVISGASVATGATASANQCLTGNSFNFTNTGSTGAPHTYEWNFTGGTPASSTNEDVTGVTWATAGTKNIQQIIFNGACSDTNNFTIVVYPVPAAALDSTDVSCFGAADGEIDATISGGTPAYTYAWSNGASTEDVTGLSGGTYTITVTDGNTCTSTASIVVNEAASSVAVTADSTDVTCGATNNGAVTSTGSGGTTPYTYTWSGGLGIGQNHGSLTSGTYTVTITDAGGCTATASTIVNSPTSMSISVAVSTNYNGEDISCNGASDGGIDLTITGGMAPFTYSWVGPGSYTNTIEDIAGLVAGAYTVTVTDGNSPACSDVASVTVVEPDTLNGTELLGAHVNVTCNGGSTGELEVQAIGTSGVSPYQYSIDGGTTQQGTGAFTGLAAGNYTIQIEDANNCLFDFGPVTITEPAAITTSTAVIDTIYCNGDANGSAAVYPLGGSGAFNYVWSNGTSDTDDTTQTNLTANTWYYVTVSDAADGTCQAVDSVQLSEPTALTVTAGASDASCSGATNGSVSSTPSGGTTPYTYAWSGGLGATQNHTSTVGAGTYTITVTDGNGCTATDNATVNEPASMSVALAVTSNFNGEDISCNSASDGSIGITVSGGTPAFTYSWTGPNAFTSSADTLSGLEAGTYNVTVSDAASPACSATGTITVTQPDTLSAAEVLGSHQDITCNGGSNGELEVSVVATSGVSPYQYSIDGGTTQQASSAFTGLSAGNYTVQVEDANGCLFDVGPITISEPAVLTTSVALATTIACNGDDDASATVTPSGGSGSYNYSWSNATFDAAATTQTNLAANTWYYVTVSDAADGTCLTVDSIQATEPTALSVTAGASDASCSGATNGSVTSSATGGTTAYTYTWSGGLPATQNNNGTVGAGTYTITVEDANGCTATDQATVNEPASMSVALTVTSNYNGEDISCNSASDGSIGITVSGGTPAFTYSWTGPNAFTSAADTLTGLEAGTYNVTVSDAASPACSATGSITVTEPDTLNASEVAGSHQDVTCNGGNNGELEVSVVGTSGVGPYQYSIDGGTTQQGSASFTGLTAGAYTVQVEDANGCLFDVGPIAITEPVALSSSVALATTIACNGDDDASATVTPAGGSGAYNYTWSNATFDATATTQTNLAANTWYYVTVSDAADATCQTIDSIQPTEPTVLGVTAGASDASCSGASNGSATSTPTGGTTAYTYSWSGGLGASQNHNGTVSAGTYTVTVEDANGCTATDQATVGEPASMSVSLTVTSNYNGEDVSCNGGSDASVGITVAGGTPIYTYSWTGPNAFTSAADTLTGLEAGTYNVTVSDAAAPACSATGTITVTQPDTLNASEALPSHQDVTCNGGSNGELEVSVVGSSGVGPYQYSIDGGTTQQGSASFTGLAAGPYTVQVEDANGCLFDVGPITITEPVALSTSVAIASAIDCNGDDDASATVTPAGGSGGYNYSWSNATFDATATTQTNLVAGTWYYVTVSDAADATCQTIDSIQPSEPTVLAVTAGASDATCNGASNGSVTSTPTGGTTAYTYSWSGGLAATQNNAGTVAAGTYTVTVEDANGCTATDQATVNEPASMAITLTVTSNYNGEDVSCTSASDGSVGIAVSGGTPTYTYSWTGPNAFASAADTLTGLEAGTYNVTVTDAAAPACTATANITLTEPDTLNVSEVVPSHDDVSCNGGSNGVLQVSVVGTSGVAPYQYSIDGGTTQQGSPTFTGLSAGAYTVQVEDANGCLFDVTPITITEPAAIGSSIAPVAVTCNGGSDGQATVVPSGGSGGFNYQWDNASFDATATTTANLSPGTTYHVTITDATDASCQKLDSITPTEPAPIVATAGSTPATCGVADGTITVSISSGGSPTFNYSLDGGTTTQASNTFNALTAGAYTATVIDGNGCTGTAAVNVANASAPSISLDAKSNVDCNGGSSGGATVSATGGTGALTYQWYSGSPPTGSSLAGETAVTIAGLAAGNYYCVVEDANTCVDAVSVTITQPSLVGTNPTVTQAVTCNGGSNGAVTVSTNGGTPYIASTAYTYQWFSGSPPSGSSIGGATTAATSGLLAGSYYVVATDSLGCTDTSNAITVTEATALTASIAPVVVSCFNGADGQATVTPGGGSGAYAYAWDNTTTDATATTNSNLATDTWYHVTVSDLNDLACQIIDSILPTDPDSIELSYTSNPASCGGSDGSVTLSVDAGGSPGFDFSDDGGTTTQASATFSGLAAGAYTLTAVDNNGCTQDIAVTVSNAAAPTISLTASTNATCNGSSDGDATVNASGGTGTLTYQWYSGTPAGSILAGENSTSISGLAAGNYYCEVEDSNGCSDLVTVVITQPTTINTGPSVTQNVTCNGGSNGTTNVNASGGTPATASTAYNYQWYAGTPATGTVVAGATSASATGLSAGSYYVIVTDSVSCKDTSTAVTVTQPTPISTSIAPVVLDCFGDNNGQATVSASGGGGGKQYTWDNTTTDATATTLANLSAGTTYHVTVALLSNPACFVVDSVTPTQPDSIELSYTSTDATCGASDGTVSVSVDAGGSPGFDYSDDGGTTTQGSGTFSGLAAGGYAITVIDNNGCTMDIATTVNNAAAPSISLISDNDASCFGEADGDATVNASGGTGALTYQWYSGTPTGTAIGGETSTSISGLAAGSYYCEVADANACTDLVTVTIAQPPTINTGPSVTQQVTCNGASNGAVNVNASGGTPATASAAYSYQWFNGTPPAGIAVAGATNASATGLSAGSYYVVVTDSISCTDTSSVVTVTQPTAISTSIAAVALDCFGDNNGQATVSASGGGGGKQYSWDNATTDATATTLANLSAGTTYHVTVALLSNPACFVVDSVTPTQPDSIALSYVATDATCGAADGTLTLSVDSGGTGSFIYSLNGGTTTQASATFTGLLAGGYTITAIDGNGCSMDIAATVNNAAAPSISLTASSDASCNGTADGSATVSASGGTGALTYQWYSGNPTGTALPGENGLTLSGVGGGNFYCEVEDANGCTDLVTVSIAEPPVINTGPSVTQNATCNGTATGAVNVNVTGGTPATASAAYSYQWFSGTPPTGSAVAGATSATSTGLAAGSYYVVVTDSISCTDTSSAVTVTQPTPITTSIAAVALDCFGDSDGQATVAAGGGGSAKLYTWDNTTTDNTATTLPNLSADVMYHVTVALISNPSCFKVDSVMPTQPDSIELSFSSTQATCGAADGSVSISVDAGGTPSFQYSSNGGTTLQASNTFGGLLAGGYNIVVVDNNGCSETIATTVSNTSAPTITLGGITDVSCNGAADGAVTSTASGGTGTLTYQWYAGTAPGGALLAGETGNNLSGISGGNYYLEVADATGCTDLLQVSVNESAAIAPSATVTSHVSCNGAADGAVSVSVSGGVPASSGYTYQWFSGTAPTGTLLGGETASTMNDLSGGSFYVEVTDSVNCSATSVGLTVNEPTALTANASISTNYSGEDVSCNGASDGAIDLTVGGGTFVTAYSYSWVGPNGFTSGVEDPTGLEAGTYTVTVSDQQTPAACTVVETITLSEPTALALAMDSTDANCGQANGSATVTATGATSPYTYAWFTNAALTASIGQTSATASSLTGAMYFVEVTDANGCTNSSSIVVNNIPGPADAAITYIPATGAGFCDGSATATMTGAITWVWYDDPTFTTAIGQTSTTATALCAEDYCVIMTDANGCTGSACVNITEPTDLVVNTVTTNAVCNGDNNGTVDVTASGGIPPFTYAWSHGPTAEDLSNLAAGGYAVTVTDANGVTGADTIVIAEPVAVQLIENLAGHVNASCFGYNDGEIEVDTVAGTGVQPIVFSLDGGFTTQVSPTFTGLTQGSYTVTAVDDNGCTATATIVLTSPPQIVSTAALVSDVSCHSLSDGAVTVSAIGGTLGSNPDYAYQWYNGQPPAGVLLAGQTNDTAMNLVAGDYYVLVTDSMGCVDTSINVLVSQPNILSGTATASSNYNGSDVSCNGLFDGSIDLTVSGGTTQYTYNWSGPSAFTATNEDISALQAGTYDVTISDANGCTATASETLTEPLIVSLSGLPTNVTCNGGSDGAVISVVNGGTGPYTYQWGPPGSQTTPHLSNLSAATYALTLTDANGCSDNDSWTLTEPSAVSATTSTTLSTCLTADGTASAAASGGVLPYTYSWNDPLSQTGSTAIALYAGTYTVTIADNNGCSVTSTANVVDANTPAVSISLDNDALCQDSCNGQATASVSGGTPPLTWVWSASANAQTGLTATGLCAGTHNISVTDGNNCSTSASVAVSEPAAVQAFVLTTTSPTGNGLLNGSATASASGGTPGYSYQWDDVAMQTTATATGLPAGTYCVTATDQNGCTGTTCVTITQPAPLVVTVAANPTSCNGGSDGTTTAGVTGGVPSYSFQWFDNGTGLPIGQTLFMATGLPQGTYYVVVTDANGNTTTSGLVGVSEPTVVVATITDSSHASCFGIADAYATVTPTGGNSPYSILWDDGQVTTTATALLAGTYGVTVADVNGCTGTTSVTLTEPAPILSSVVETDATCFGSCDGTLAATASGGSSPYTYAWNDGAFQTTATATGLCAHPLDYEVTITDANGCTTVDFGNISDPTELVLNGVSTQSTCNQSDGSATIQVVNGDTPYAYLWDPNAGNQTTATASGIPSGCYDVTVSDGNGCTASETVCVTDAGAPQVFVLNTGNATCFGDNDGFAQITVGGGSVPYTYEWFDVTMTSIGQNTPSAVNLTAGTYIGQVTDASGCVANNSITITQPTNLVAAFGTVADVTCFGDEDGTAASIVSGGIMPYTYSWNDPSFQSTATATGLAPGNYDLAVVDNNGCLVNISTTIGEPAQFSIAVASTTDASCNLPMGEICVSNTNGVSPFNFQWNDPLLQVTACASNLVPDNYTVTATDGNGCSATATGTVNNIPGPTVVVSNFTDPTCFNLCDGSITVSVSGTGLPPYTYNWSNGDITNTATNLCDGQFFVTVTDANGCTAITSKVLNKPPAIALNVTGYDAGCPGEASGSAMVVASDGTGPYDYQWDNATMQTVDSATNLISGLYHVTVTDANGCSDVDSVFINQPAAILLDSIVSSAHCGQADGAACVTISGGTAPFTYNWPFTGLDTACVGNLTAGGYVVTVTDANGCTNTNTVNVQDLGAPTAVISASSNVSCNGGSNGSATVSISGGSGGLSQVDWYNSFGQPINQTTPVATNLAAGIYIVQISDGAGCLASTSVTISQPSPINHSISGIDPECNGYTNGKAWITAVGGTPPYAYNWDDPATQLTDTAFTLVAGSYTVVIVDNNGCSTSNSITLVEPPAITTTTALNDADCYGNSNGQASVFPSNGVAPYTYIWDDANAQTTQTASGLGQGLYTVTISDFNGCATINQVTVGQPDPLQITVTNFGNLSCYQDASGFISATASGGNSPYAFNWDNMHFNATATNLTAGVHSVTVTDAIGCQGTLTQTLIEPAPITLTIPSVTNLECAGDCNGEATLNITGGAGGFNILWDGNTGFQTTSTATALCAGQYTVSITDGNGCSTDTSLSITQPTGLGLLIDTIIQPNCGQSNGSVQIIAAGGTFPYVYSWNDANTQTGALATALSSGCYTIDMVDANGCLFDSLICVSDINAPNIALNGVSNVSCAGNSDGFIAFNVSGGTGPYQPYEWTDFQNNTYPQFLGSDNATGLQGDITYVFSVVDAAGCMGSFAQYIEEPPTLLAQINQFVLPGCFAGTGGEATVSVGGGSMPYTYSWNDPNFQTTATATGLPQGTYTAVVTDSSGCTVSDQIALVAPSAINFSNSAHNTSCFGACDGSISVSQNGGTQPYLWQWDQGLGYLPTANNLCAGTYHVTLTDANSCTAVQTIVIAEPGPVQTAVAALQDAICTDFTGQASVVGSPTGATPYSYMWSEGTNIATAVNLFPGDYFVTTTDADGCSVIDTVTIGDTPAPDIDIVFTEPVCYGQFSGTAAVNIISGQGPYSYLWDGTGGAMPQSTTQAIGLPAGTYTVTITDGNGCTTVESSIMNEPPQLIAVPFAADDDLCFGECTQIWASASGGTPFNTVPFYNLIWVAPHDTINPLNTAIVCPEQITDFCYTVSDQNGCVVTSTNCVSINVHPALDVTASLPLQICIEDTAAIGATAFGGVGNYTFEWSNGFTETTGSFPESNQTVQPFGTTTYIVTLTDGCSEPVLDTTEVIVHPRPPTGFTADVQSGCPPLEVSFTGVSDPGFPNLSYAWDFNIDGLADTTGQFPIWAFNEPGQHTVAFSATSQEGCTTNDTISNFINVFDKPLAEFEASPYTTTIVNPDVAFDAENYSQDAIEYYWNFGDGSLANGGTATHTYIDTGLFSVQLHVVNDLNCVDSIAKDVYIGPDYTIFIPNAFSPNGDGLNDEFIPNGLGIDIDSYVIRIFTRWGNLIYEGEDPWDGTYKGRVVKSDVYAYKINVVDFRGEEHEYRGHISVVK